MLSYNVSLNILLSQFYYHINSIKHDAYQPFQARVYHCHLHPLQAENCCRNYRLIVDEDDLMWVKY